MSNEAEILPNLLRDETFEIVMRGYNRRQVDDTITRSQNQIRDLEARLARALDDIERARREMAEVRDARKPTGDDLSDRLRQIINLAEDEAKEKLAEAEKVAAQIRSDAEKESKRITEDARGHAEREISSAQDKAGQVLNAAKNESEKVLTAAKHEAEQTVTGARLEAERTLTQAERRSSVINEDATERLNHLNKNHSAALQRLTDISHTLSALLRAENEAGPLEKMIEQAVKQPVRRPAPATPAPRPAPVTTPPAPAHRKEPEATVTMAKPVPIQATPIAAQAAAAIEAGNIPDEDDPIPVQAPAPMRPISSSELTD
jgi:cell division septum initiation protein DivIVA